MRRPVDYLLLFLKGTAMGAADVVPGVSGGTIAFISGIYQEFLNSIRSVNLQSLKLLRSHGITAFWSAINGNFLLVLFAGILVSIFSLAKLVSYCLDVYPVLVWSFFFGLIIASIIWITRNLGRWGIAEALAVMAGTVLSALLFFLPPLVVGSSPLTVFCAGAIAICAMILPGVSGSFILVLLGMYGVLIDAISALDFTTLALFALGCVVGLLSFSRVLSWLLERYYSVTLSTLVGFLAGSLATVWPWRNPVELVYTSSGKEIVLVQENLLPWEYAELMGRDPHTWVAILLMVFGVVLVLGLEHIGGKRATV